MTPKWAIVCLILLAILILELMLFVALLNAWQAGANVIPLWIAP